MRRNPPDILITTPESLYLMLTSQAREMLDGVEAVIVDEIHAVAADQARRAPRADARAARRAPAERRDVAADRPVARRRTRSRRSGASWSARGATCTVVDAGVRKPLDLKIHVPVESMVEPDAGTSTLDRSIRSPAARRPAARSGRRSTPSCSARRASTARRSCSSTTAAAPSGSRCA